MKDPSTNTNLNQDLFNMEYRKIVLLDFDGVIHWYREGWKGSTEIYDDPVPGAIDYLEYLGAFSDTDDERVFDIQIYSSRSQHDGGIDAMRKWLRKEGLQESTLAQIRFPTEKPAAWLTIDDRCFQFRGAFPTPEYLIGYEAWMKSSTSDSVLADANVLRSIAGAHFKADSRNYGRLLRIAGELDGTWEGHRSDETRTH